MFPVWVTGCTCDIHAPDLSLAIWLDFQLQHKNEISTYVRGMSRVIKKESVSCGLLPSRYLPSIWEDEIQTQELMNRGWKTRFNQKQSVLRTSKEGSDDDYGSRWQFWELHQKGEYQDNVSCRTGLLWTKDHALVLGCGMDETQQEEGSSDDPGREEEVPTV